MKSEVEKYETLGGRLSHRLLLVAVREALATEHYGRVASEGCRFLARRSPRRGDKQLNTITDQEASIDRRFPGWRVDDSGRHARLFSGQPGRDTGRRPTFYLGVEAGARGDRTDGAPQPAASSFQRAAVNATMPENLSNPSNPSNLSTSANLSNPETLAVTPTWPSAADGFLVNGSVNNGAASPFSQLAQFGNNRRGLRSCIMAASARSLVARHSMRGISFTSNQKRRNPTTAISSSLNDRRSVEILDPRNGPNLFALYQRTSDHSEHPARIDADRAERRGDFADTRRAGPPIQIIDPRPVCRLRWSWPRGSNQPAGCRSSVITPPRTLTRRTATTISGQSSRRRGDSVQTRLTQPGFGRNCSAASRISDDDRYRQCVRVRIERRCPVSTRRSTGRTVCAIPDRADPLSAQSPGD